MLGLSSNGDNILELGLKQAPTLRVLIRARGTAGGNCGTAP
jgi:hypothetical protein